MKRLWRNATLIVAVLVVFERKFSSRMFTAPAAEEKLLFTTRKRGHMMKMGSFQTIILVLVSAAMGAGFYANIAPGRVRAEEKSIEFIKKDHLTTVKSVAVSTSGNRLVFITGQTGMDPQMKMSDDIGEQADSALENLGRELAAAGVNRTDVAKLTIYVKDLDLVEGGFVLRSVQTYFDGANVPVITWVGVTNLILPEALVEIEAIAVASN